MHWHKKQGGTPEEIVTDPVDDYVADFVAGISKLDLISAAKIMEPLGRFQQRRGLTPRNDWPEAQPEDSLDELVDLSIATQHPIIIKADGKPIGVVTKNALLRGIQGKTDELPALENGVN